MRLTGGADREGGGDGPLVVLLHGFGAPGDDLVPLWRQLAVPSGTRFAFPEAPLDLGGGARAWWMIDIERLERALRSGELRDMSNETPAGLTEAHAKASAMLDELDQELAPSSLVLGGFSQGAMLACDLVLSTERQVSGLVLMSTTLLSEPEWTLRMPKRSGLPVLMSHGRDDPLLPFALGERLRDLFVAAGLSVEWISFNGGHGIAPSVLDRLGEFVTRVTR